MDEHEEILERKTKKPQKKLVKLMKVLWKNKHGGDMPGKLEGDMRARYPCLFNPILDYGMEYS